MKRSTYPRWAYPSQHAFRAKKRAEVRQLRRLVAELRTGCAYLPAGCGALETIAKIADALADEVSVKRWGR